MRRRSLLLASISAVLFPSGLVGEEAVRASDALLIGFSGEGAEKFTFNVDSSSEYTFNATKADFKSGTLIFGQRS